MPNTSNFQIPYAVVGGDENQWGTITNNAILTIDSTIKTVSDAIPTSVVATSITDTPDSLGTADQQLKMNTGGTALEFFTPSITNLSDTPSSLGSANQILKMNSGGTALEWTADDSGGSTSGFATETWVNSNFTTTTTLNSTYYTASQTLLLALGYSPRIYTSPAQTPSANQYIDLTHNLKEKGSASGPSSVSQAPDFVQILFKCTSADLGYSAGDIIHWQDHFADTNSIPYVIVESGNVTQLRLYFGGTGYYHLPSKNSGTAGYTNGGAIGKWQLIVKAWAY